MSEQARATGIFGRALVVAVAASLAGCGGVDRQLAVATVPDDYRARHPIVVTEAPVTLEIYASGAKLDMAAHDRIVALAHEAKQAAHGNIEILFPQGAANEHRQRAALPAIRRALAAGGARGYVSVGVYPLLEPSGIAPIQLRYRALRGQVASTCGQWPDDLGSGSSLRTWENRPYWNHGCAYQNMFATQVAEPSDLVEPRATTPGDVEMRIRAIGKVRQGADPGTTWVTKNSSIGTVGGN